jgi:hypothetical protein
MGLSKSFLVSGIIKDHNCLLCFGSGKFEQYRGHCQGLSQSSWCLESRTIIVYFVLVLENLNSIEGTARAFPRAFGVWNQES